MKDLAGALAENLIAVGKLSYYARFAKGCIPVYKIIPAKIPKFSLRIELFVDNLFEFPSPS